MFCSAYALLSTVAIIYVCVGFYQYYNTPDKADYKGLPMGVTASFMMDYAWVGMSLMVGLMLPDRDVPVYVSVEIALPSGPSLAPEPQQIGRIISY